MESIESFCNRHRACEDGKKWALENCSNMTDVWEKAEPEWFIWVATRLGVLDEKTLRLFAIWCVRQVWNFLVDERSRNAVLVSEKFANGEATKENLSNARAAAQAAAWAAARSAACAAAQDAAWAAAWFAAGDGARAAAWAAARSAAWSAAWAAARSAAWSDARDAQAKWLRENAKPNFEVNK